jgi:hypothetical protein
MVIYDRKEYYKLNRNLRSCKTFKVQTGNTKRGSITVQLTSCSTGLDWPVLQIKTKIVSSHTADSKPVKQEVNGTVILPPLVFPGTGHKLKRPARDKPSSLLNGIIKVL